MSQASLVAKAIEMQCSHVLAPPSQVFHCPITHELFVDPVLAADGHTYERDAIQRHFNQHRIARSPMANTNLGSKDVISNHSIKKAIEEYKDKVVRAASEVLPLVVEFGDFGMAEMILDRAREYAGGTQVTNQMHLCLVAAQIPAAARESNIEVVLEKLQHLSQLDAVAAESAIADFTEDFLGGVLEAMPNDHLATVFALHERVRRQMDQIVAQFRSMDHVQLSSVPKHVCRSITAILRRTGGELSFPNLIVGKKPPTIVPSRPPLRHVTYVSEYTLPDVFELDCD